MSEILSFSAETRVKSKPQNCSSEKWTLLPLSRASVSPCQWKATATNCFTAGSQKEKAKHLTENTVRTSSWHFSVVFSAYWWGLVKHSRFHSFWFYPACSIHMRLKGDHKQGGDPRNNKRGSLWQTKANRVNCNNKYFALWNVSLFLPSFQFVEDPCAKGNFPYIYKLLEFIYCYMTNILFCHIFWW